MEPFEAVSGRAGGQALQKKRADTLALKTIVHRECDFGRSVRHPDVRRDGDDADLPFDVTAGDEGQVAAVLGRSDEPVDDRRWRLAGRKESTMSRVGREIVEEAAQRVPVLRPGGPDGRGRPVTKHEARRIQIVGRRR